MHGLGKCNMIASQHSEPTEIRGHKFKGRQSLWLCFSAAIVSCIGADAE